MTKYLIGRYVTDGKSEDPCDKLVLMIVRVADPLFGLTTGVAAYFIWEKDQRNAHDHGPGNTLVDLVSRRFGIENPLHQLYEKNEQNSKPKTQV